MKKIAFILMIAISLAGGALAITSAPSYAQGDEFPPPPQNPYESPWVGPDTPWVYYNGDWFLDGTLYYFFGPNYGWAPYYAYAPNYIVRPGNWYSPRWLGWYRGHPQYWEGFNRQYPYWREHREGQHYDQRFFEQHSRGHGGEWQKGFDRSNASPSHREGHKPGPAQVAPDRQHPGEQRDSKPEQQQRESKPEQQQREMKRESQPQQTQQQKERQSKPEQQQHEMKRESQPQQSQPQMQRESKPEQQQHEMKRESQPQQSQPQMQRESKPDQQQHKQQTPQGGGEKEKQDKKGQEQQQ